MRPGRILMPTGKNGEEKESGMGNESEGKNLITTALSAIKRIQFRRQCKKDFSADGPALGEKYKQKALRKLRRVNYGPKSNPTEKFSSLIQPHNDIQNRYFNQEVKYG
jgi:hypothetical protein